MEFVDDEAQRTVTVPFRSFLSSGEYTHRIVHEVRNGEHTPRYQTAGDTMPNLQKLRHKQQPDTFSRFSWDKAVTASDVFMSLPKWVITLLAAGNAETKLFLDGCTNLMHKFLCLVKAVTDRRDIAPTIIHDTFPAAISGQ